MGEQGMGVVEQGMAGRRLGRAWARCGLSRVWAWDRDG